MLLNQIARRFGSLVGKGLSWGVIAEVFVLSLPFILAMTIPMAVLLAVLYAMSHLAADNEVTALRASGVSVPQILRPLLVWGVLMSALTFLFVDQVLPETNARLRGLLIDIGRKKPTFELREQVINEVPPSKFFLRSGRIDGATGQLRGVTIYDVGNEHVRRVIYADSGFMAYAPGGRDLTLQLYHGVIHQYKTDEPDRFQLTAFVSNEHSRQERLRRAGAEHLGSDPGGPRDVELRDVRRCPRRRSGRGQGGGGSAVPARPRPARAAPAPDARGRTPLGRRRPETTACGSASSGPCSRRGCCPGSSLPRPRERPLRRHPQSPRCRPPPRRPSVTPRGSHCLRASPSTPRSRWSRPASPTPASSRTATWSRSTRSGRSVWPASRSCSWVWPWRFGSPAAAWGS